MSQELAAVDLGDRRLNARLLHAADAWSLEPGTSLPRASRTGAALEGTYRLLSNPKVQPAKILEPHLSATSIRAKGDQAVLAIHDTTEFGFGGQSRAKLGRTHNSKPGYFAHMTLAVRASNREPLGVLGIKMWARCNQLLPKKLRRTHQYRMRPDRESNRWGQAVAEVEKRVDASTRLIHVMDREGDQYRLLDQIVAARGQFVIRGSYDRLLASPKAWVSDAFVGADVFLEREVSLSRRRPKHGRAAHKPRDARTATLQVSATTVEVRRSKGPHNRNTAPSITLNAVRVFEVNPPDDEEPVEWLLLTTLSIATPESVAFIVDCYRARWMIEELFKAVKTGCAYEKLQLESELALRNALAIILPIAWQMLLLRSLARMPIDVPATRVLTETQIATLRDTPWTKSLPARPTAKDVLRVLAALGGHIKNNGDPGWQVLYRGFRDLRLLEIGRRSSRSDQ